MKDTDILTIAEELKDRANDAYNRSNYLESCEYYFYAGEGFEKGGKQVLAADCYKMSFISNIRCIETLKDFVEERYLDNMESILLENKRFNLLQNNFHQIELCLRNHGYHSMSSKYYLKKMSYKTKLLRKQRSYGWWLIYSMWNCTSKHGESFFRWLISLLVISSVYSIAFWPAPFESMQSIKIVSNTMRLRTFADYLFFSLITFAPWDWRYITPLNTWGQLFILSISFLGFLMFGLLLNLMTRKFMRA